MFDTNQTTWKPPGTIRPTLIGPWSWFWHLSTCISLESVARGLNSTARCFIPTIQVNFIFLVGTTNWGAQDPHELIRYCSPIYVLYVSSHFWPFTKGNILLENFNKNFGFDQTPPPCLAKCPTFSGQKLDGSPKDIVESIDIDMGISVNIDIYININKNILSEKYIFVSRK